MLVIVAFFSYMQGVLFAKEATSDTAKNEKSGPSVSIRGAVQLDQFYLLKPSQAKKQTSGALLQTADFSLGVDFHNKIKLNWDISLDGKGSANIGTLFLEFTPLDNTAIMLGQVPSPWCLENSNSSKWIPFLERSLASGAFKPCIGPGVNVRHWREHLAFQFALRQPPYGWFAKEKEESQVNDHWGGSTRLTWSPIHAAHHVVHVGGSYSFQDVSKKVSFKASEVKSRSGLVLVGTGDISAKNYQVYGVEFAYLWNAFQLEAEYIHNQVARRENKEGVSFDGWHVQANYFLTGQSRKYDATGGTFGAPDLAGKSAWQVAFRYSAINLNADDISGGKENNISAALNWYINKNIKVSTNYVRSIMTEKKEASDQTVDSISFRIQTVF